MKKAYIKPAVEQIIMIDEFNVFTQNASISTTSITEENIEDFEQC